jgi:DNA adenine methylase
MDEDPEDEIALSTIYIQSGDPSVRYRVEIQQDLLTNELEYKVVEQMLINGNYFNNAVVGIYLTKQDAFEAMTQQPNGVAPELTGFGRNSTALMPLFGRQGNKFYLRDRIMKFFPREQSSIYVELFAGSGAIFFNKDKAETNVLNDLDKNTTANLNLLKNPPSPAETAKFKPLNTLSAVKKFFTKNQNNPNMNKTDKMVFNKIMGSSGFNNKPVVKASGIYKILNYKNWLNKLPLYKEALKGVKITNKDYSKIVNEYDSPNTFFFIDPPYENTNTSFGYAEDDEFDFERLNQVLRSIKGKFLMTINDSATIRRLFKGFKQRKLPVVSSWQNKDSHNAKQDGNIRRELIITNYS